MDKCFHGSLKAKDSLFNKTWAALIVDESLDWNEVSFSFAFKRYFAFTQDKLIKCL